MGLIFLTQILDLGAPIWVCDSKLCYCKTKNQKTHQTSQNILKVNFVATLRTLWSVDDYYWVAKIFVKYLQLGLKCTKMRWLIAEDSYWNTWFLKHLSTLSKPSLTEPCPIISCLCARLMCNTPGRSGCRLSWQTQSVCVRHAWLKSS